MYESFVNLVLEVVVSVAPCFSFCLPFGVSSCCEHSARAVSLGQDVASPVLEGVLSLAVFC